MWKTTCILDPTMEQQLLMQLETKNYTGASLASETQTALNGSVGTGPLHKRQLKLLYHLPS